jgi:hypothetical protein
VKKICLTCSLPCQDLFLQAEIAIVESCSPREDKLKWIPPNVTMTVSERYTRQRLQPKDNSNPWDSRGLHSILSNCSSLPLHFRSHKFSSRKCQKQKHALLFVIDNGPFAIDNGPSCAVVVVVVVKCIDHGAVVVLKVGAKIGKSASATANLP